MVKETRGDYPASNESATVTADSPSQIPNDSTTPTHTFMSLCRHDREAPLSIHIVVPMEYMNSRLGSEAEYQTVTRKSLLPSPWIVTGVYP